MQIRINYIRPIRGTTVYLDELLSDDGRCLTTLRLVPVENQLALARTFWRAGLLPETTRLGSVRAHYFYSEYFNILTCFDIAGRLAGYYSDIATPLEKLGDSFCQTDLFLDFWLAPGQPPRALDEDEFDDAVARGLLSPAQEAGARAAFARLRHEIAAGIFPYRYIRT